MSNEWPKVRLGEVLSQVSDPCAVKPDQQYPNFGIFSFGRGLFAKPPISGMESRATTLFRVRQGQFIYSRLFAFEGAYGLVTAEFDGHFVSNEYPVFDCDSNRILPKYLEAYFKRPAVWEEVARLSTGLGDRRRRVQPDQFLTHCVPLPPLPEQRRIVAKTGELTARIEEARGLRQLAMMEVDSIVASIDVSLYGSQNWKWTTVGDLIGTGNLRNGKSVKPVQHETGFRCLRLSALQDSRINCHDAKPVALSEEDAHPYRVNPGDVFVVRGNGSKRLVGRAGYAQEIIQGTIFPDLFIRIPLPQDAVVTKFFVSFWNSRRMRIIIEDTCKTTSGIWKINQGHIESFSVPIPPIEEQRRVVAHLDGLQSKVDCLKTLHTQSQAEFAALLPSILDRAFRGEL